MAKNPKTTIREFILITPEGIAYTEAKTVQEAADNLSDIEPTLGSVNYTIIVREKKLRLGSKDYHSIWVDAVTGEIYPNHTLIK